MEQVDQGILPCPLSQDSWEKPMSQQAVVEEASQEEEAPRWSSSQVDVNAELDLLH